MKRIGIMGGTFNPIHNGHITIAKAAYEQYSLDEVWFMPNHIPGYKSKEDLVSGDNRLAMVELAIQDYPYFKSSDFELQRTGNTYTAETMKLLCEQYEDTEFFFILGMDSLLYFDKWKNPETIIKYTKILAAPRNKSSIQEMHNKINELKNLFKQDVFFAISCEEIDCSSSEIRNQIHHLYELMDDSSSDQTEISHLPKQVMHYIIEHHLYA